MLPNDLPPWPGGVTNRPNAGSRPRALEEPAHDLRGVLRVAGGRAEQPTAVIVDSRIVQSTSTSGARASYEGTNRRKSAKVHAIVGPLGHLHALLATASNEQDCAQVGALAADVQATTGDYIEPGRRRSR